MRGGRRGGLVSCILCSERMTGISRMREDAEQIAEEKTGG
jgi:hypothetical protein